jgi:prepilin-type N-terminal cleavage/methylation domain-containing protein
MKRTSAAGFSLVEMIIVASILSFALGVPLMILRSAERMRSTVTTHVELQAMARQAIDRIASRLESSRAAMIPQSLLGPGLWSPVVDFQIARNWSGASVNWGPPERIALLPSPEDPDDGLDNDSDGKIDERYVVWTTDVGLPTQRIVVLRRDVPEHLAGEIAGNGIDDNGNGLIDEAGLSFEFVGDQVVIRLSLQGHDSANATIEHTEERRIAFRN